MRIPFFLFSGLLICGLACQPASPGSEEDRPTNIETTNAPQPEAISFDGRELFPPPETTTSQQRKDSNLLVATRKYEADPNNLENIIWVGRRTAYLSRYRESIEIYTKGLEQFPESPELYRHRGHRYISIRQLDKAIADFEKAAQLVEGREIEMEPDGIPNKLNIPLSSLQFNIWYHWALAYYLKADFAKAAELYEQCMIYSTNPDLLTATSDWLYMTYRRLGQKEKAQQVLAPITTDLEVIENASYLNRLLLYKGLKKPEELLDLNNEDPDRQLEIVTQGYGVGNWYLYEGEADKAKNIFEKMMKTQYWPAFGYIAAEADLARM